MKSPAIPELMDRINLKGAIITIDAMGCPKDIARRILNAQGDQVLTVKDNQPKLHEAIQGLFSDERQAERLQGPHGKYQTSEKSAVARTSGITPW